MTASLLLVSLAVLFGGGLFCAIGFRSGRWASHVGATVAVLGALPAAWSAGVVLYTGRSISLSAAGSLPLGSLQLGVDPLSAFFVLPIALVCALAAVYGVRYMADHGKPRSLGVFWCFYNMLTAGMLLVVVARDSVLFLIAWEAMSLSSFFLVMHEHDRPPVRQAGWIYLAATHLGTAFLLVMFVLLGGGATTMEFSRFVRPGSPLAAGAVFLLAVVGFGAKAGFVPMHVWLPEAHPAAPSPVSAVMSGVMIKMGIYGIVRVVTFLGAPAQWWGWTLLGIGAASAVMGVLFAIAQHDIKRLLAYHSVENIGIICLGLGLWLLGAAGNHPTLAMLGLLGGLLHVWNHAVFKSLLFLGAGAVAHSTGTLNMELLGGLGKRMPKTAVAFLLGAAAICGLPPLNGFVSEFLIYYASFAAMAEAHTARSLVAGSLTCIGVLALIGGLAAACFAKVFGIVFLGEPRSRHSADAHEAPAAMHGVMAVLAALCVVLGFAGPPAVYVASLAASTLPGVGTMEQDAATVQKILGTVSLAGVVLVLLIVGLWLLRRRLLAGRPVAQAGTWDCGYIAPNARMQYTASSFAWPIIDMFRWLLRPRLHSQRPQGLFPERAAFESHTDDLAMEYLYRPAFRAVAWVAERVRRLQEGRNQLYVLYIVVVVLVLLLWKLR